MLYRRKVLLALLEACGGELSNTDMEKLLFVYCDERGKNYYNFFPYRYGCFSFLSYQDKRVLTKYGYLVDSEKFKLNKRISKRDRLEIEDQQYLRDFVRKTKNLRGNALVRHVYLKYPYYAIRSEIRIRVLTPKENEIVELQRPRSNEICLFTLGYEGLTIDAYIDKLVQNNISFVIDVRRNPFSMKYGFSKTEFRNYLHKAGILYEHIPELGIESSQRKGLETEKDYQKLFKKYSTCSLPNKMHELAKIQQLLFRYKRIALTCFEANSSSCHRRQITEHLQSTKNWNTPIEHIV